MDRIADKADKADIWNLKNRPTCRTRRTHPLRGVRFVRYGLNRTGRLPATMRIVINEKLAVRGTY
jgi:hypothetical protein